MESPVPLFRLTGWLVYLLTEGVRFMPQEEACFGITVTSPRRAKLPKGLSVPREMFPAGENRTGTPR